MKISFDQKTFVGMFKADRAYIAVAWEIECPRPSLGMEGGPDW